jgi:hypothetical protein
MIHDASIGGEIGPAGCATQGRGTGLAFVADEVFEFGTLFSLRTLTR